MNVLGPHQDKTQDLVPGSSIVSISLGATRTFRISKKEGGKKIKVKDYELTNGTVIIMRKEMQDKYYHEIEQKIWRSKNCWRNGAHNRKHRPL